MTVKMDVVMRATRLWAGMNEAWTLFDLFAEAFRKPMYSTPMSAQVEKLMAFAFVRVQARLGGLRDRAEVAAMVERDNLEVRGAGV